VKLKANEIEINCEVSGKQDAPVVAMSHSLGSSLTMWNPQIEALESHFLVLRYDMRGHGGSDTPHGAYTLEQLGEDAVGLLDTLRIQIVHWVGLSIGGMIGQYLALNHADRLRSLVLCDTAAAIPEEAQARRRPRRQLPLPRRPPRHHERRRKQRPRRRPFEVRMRFRLGIHCQALPTSLALIWKRLPRPTTSPTQT